MLRRPPRVTHGIAPIHSLRDSVLADRTAGCLAESVVLYAQQTTRYELTTGHDFDVVFSASVHESTGQYWKCLCHLLLRTDIWNSSFRPLLPAKFEIANSAILRLLKLVGIRIIVFPYGADVAWRDDCRDRFDWVGRMQLDYPQWDLREWGTSARANVRVFCTHADIVIGMDGSLRRFLPRNDLYCKPIPVNTALLKPNPHAADNRVPVIVHAPNHRNVKGTDLLLAALEILRSKGIEFELRLIEGMERAKAFAAYRGADIVADQFVMGAYGVFALECLALGKPVLTYLDQDHLANPVFNLPIVNTNRGNLAAVLAVLLQVPELRQRIGAAAREAVARYQSLEAIGELNKMMYEHLWWGTSLDLASTAHFDTRRSARSFTEDPADMDFWPVDTRDLTARIQLALERLTHAQIESGPGIAPLYQSGAQS